MPNFDAIRWDHVLSAVHEYDRLGSDRFLRLYGFGKAREYILWIDGKSYDSKAIVGVAHKYATGTAASRTEFSGGKDGAARILENLGFVLTAAEVESSFEAAPLSGEWREASEVGNGVARSEWAAAAREVLLDSARRYQNIVTYKELAVQVQIVTGIRTSQLIQHWIGDVLGRVSDDCAQRGEPLLSALCVNAAGSVGNGYAEAVIRSGRAEPGDPDDHAALERLACYRHFNASGLPSDGGRPALVPKLAAARSRSRKLSLEERILPQCRKCHLQLAATGICDNCD